MFISRVVLVIRTGSTIDEPLALGPEVGLHGGAPLLPVGTSEDGNHLVESAGHGARNSVGSQHSQQVNATLNNQGKKYT